MTKEDRTAQAAREVARALRPVTRVYAAIMQNVVLRSNLASSTLSDSEWRDIETLVDVGSGEEQEDYDEELLYAGVGALLVFAKILSSEIKPALKTQLAQPRSALSSANRVVVEMTLSNMDENINRLVEGLKVSFEAIQRLDTAKYGTPYVLRTTFTSLADSEAWTVQ
jgi:hypothetical protein